MLTGNLEKIAEHGRRARTASVREHAGAFARRQPATRRHVDINGLVEEALNLAYHGARAQDQNFNITLEARIRRGDPARWRLVPQDVTPGSSST